MTEIVKIPFHDGEILAVEIDGKPHVILRTAFESIGVDADRQIKNVQKQPWACTSVTDVQIGEQRRHMVTADVRTFLMALATIPSSRVSDEARPKLIAYQSEVADVIDAYFSQGGAINPRATEDQLSSLIDRAKGQAEVLRLLDGIVDRHWLEAKARHVAARALGEEPEIDPATRPLTVGEYLADRGLSGADLRSVSSTFGKRLKAAYRAEYLAEPPKVERFVDGALRDVAGYTEAHRPLFDQVWRDVLALSAA